MIQPDAWMNELTDRLKARFQNRLLFVGLQGSYQRREAHAKSDIDAVVILDSLTITDLIAYRELLKSMPESNYACGFISGKSELHCWAKHEIFQFEQDTRAFYGTLHDLLPVVTRQDIVYGVKAGASNLYHFSCHTAVHNADSPETLAGLYKGAFFLLQLVYYLREGTYVHTKKELLPLLCGDEKEILSVSMSWPACSEQIRNNPDTYFDLLIRWASELLVKTED